MSQGQIQWLALASVCFAGALLLSFLYLSGRRTHFVIVFGVGMLLSSFAFGSLAVLNPGGLRQQVVSALAPELFFVMIFAWICLAQAGHLPGRTNGTLPAVASRPRLRRALMSSPVVLGVAWISSLALGMAWPSAAMQPYAEAPASYLLYKWPLMLIEASYAVLASAVFLTAVGPRVPNGRLRAKNAAFAISAFCCFIIALNAAVHAAVRFWVADAGLRWTLVGVHLRLEIILAILSVAATAFGLALRYEPPLSATLLQRLQSAWLGAYDRFEALRWRSVAAGQAREAIRASYHLSRAAEWLGLPEPNTKKALEVVQLLAAMKNASPEEEALKPLNARELYEAQTEVLRNEALASRFAWSGSWGSTATELQTISSAPLYDALGAALDMIGETQADPQGPAKPLWYHLAAVSALDAGLAPPARTEGVLARQPGYATAQEAYRRAKVEM